MGRLSDDGRPLEHWIGNEIGALMQQLGLAPEPVGEPAAT
jgi:hypothetical protein